MTGSVRGAATAVLLACSPGAVLADQSLDLRIEANFTSDNNVTRARTAGDKLSDRSFGLTVTKGFEFAIPDSANTRVVASAFLGREQFQNYHGLSRYFAGGQGEFQYRAAGDFGTPIFAAFVRSSMDQYDSTLRDGYRNSVGVSVRKSVTDRIDAFGALAWNKRDGKSAVFDDKDYSARLNVDYSLTRNGTVYLSGEYRKGDVVSTARPGLSSLDIASAIVRDDVFTDTARTSYRIDARTVLATLGYNQAFSHGQAVDISWRMVRSTPTASPGFTGPGTSDSYYVNQLSLSYLVQF